MGFGFWFYCFVLVSFLWVFFLLLFLVWVGIFVCFVGLFLLSLLNYQWIGSEMYWERGDEKDQKFLGFWRSFLRDLKLELQGTGLEFLLLSCLFRDGKWLLLEILGTDIKMINMIFFLKNLVCSEEHIQNVLFGCSGFWGGFFIVVFFSPLCKILFYFFQYDTQKLCHML